MGHRLSEQAAADLDEIWYYAAKEGGGLEIADRLIDSISDTARLYQDNQQSINHNS